MLRSSPPSNEEARLNLLFICKRPLMSTHTDFTPYNPTTPKNMLHHCQSLS